MRNGAKESSALNENRESRGGPGVAAKGDLLYMKFILRSGRSASIGDREGKLCDFTTEVGSKRSEIWMTKR